MKKIINAAVIFLESAIFFLLFTLERLSGKKAGVNHHVLARKLQWSEKYFTTENINIIFPCIIAVLAGVIFVQAAVYIRGNILRAEVVQNKQLRALQRGHGVALAGGEALAFDGVKRVLRADIHHVAALLQHSARDGKGNKYVFEICRGKWRHG